MFVLFCFVCNFKCQHSLNHNNAGTYACCYLTVLGLVKWFKILITIWRCSKFTDRVFPSSTIYHLSIFHYPFHFFFSKIIHSFGKTKCAIFTCHIFILIPLFPSTLNANMIKMGQKSRPENDLTQFRCTPETLDLEGFFFFTPYMYLYEGICIFKLTFFFKIFFSCEFPLQHKLFFN